MIWYANTPVSAGVAVSQPIAFSHKHHVGDDGIDCRYCHTSVETSNTAGMPSTSICLSCHSQLYRDSPALAPLHASLVSGEPIAWNRVYDLPDFVYFDHSIHVNKGVACVNCHGRVDRMPIMLRQQELTMEWCLDCHRAPEKKVGSPDHVFQMQGAPKLTEEEQQQLLQLLSLEDTDRLTSCSTCHR